MAFRITFGITGLARKCPHFENALSAVPRSCKDYLSVLFSEMTHPVHPHASLARNSMELPDDCLQVL